MLDGIEVVLGEYPHMVALGYPTIGNDPNPYDFLCGATLIDKKFVITAAHCMNNKERLPEIARMGIVNMDNLKDVIEIRIKVGT